MGDGVGDRARRVSAEASSLLKLPGVDHRTDRVRQGVAVGAERHLGPLDSDRATDADGVLGGADGRGIAPDRGGVESSVAAQVIDR